MASAALRQSARDCAMMCRLLGRSGNTCAGVKKPARRDCSRLLVQTERQWWATAAAIKAGGESGGEFGDAPPRQRGRRRLDAAEYRRQSGWSARIKAQKAIRPVLGWLGFDKLLPILFVGGDVQKNTVNQNTIGLDATQDVFGTLVSRDVETLAICSHTTDAPDGFMRTFRIRSIPRDAGDLTAHYSVPSLKLTLKAAKALGLEEPDAVGRVDRASRKAGDFPFYRFHLAARSRCWAIASGFLTFTHAWQRPEL
jgi:hypothetical protein